MITALTLSVFLVRSAEATDAYTSFSDPLADLPEPMLEDPFGGDPLGTPDGRSFAQQEQSMDQEVQSAGADQDVFSPSQYPRSEPAQKFERSSKKKKIVKKGKSKKMTKKKSVRAKKYAHQKPKSKKKRLPSGT